MTHDDLRTARRTRRRVARCRSRHAAAHRRARVRAIARRVPARVRRDPRRSRRRVGQQSVRVAHRRCRRPPARVRSAGTQPSAAPARGLSRDPRPRRRAVRPDRAVGAGASPRSSPASPGSKDTPATMPAAAARHVERVLEPARRDHRGHQARRRAGDHVGRGRAPVPAVPRRRRAPGELRRRVERVRSESLVVRCSSFAVRAAWFVADRRCSSCRVVSGVAATLHAQTSVDSLPELTEPVNDFAHVIDPASAAEMERMIRALQEKTGDVVVVATVPTIEPYGTSKEYAVKLFENHGRGIGAEGQGQRPADPARGQGAARRSRGRLRPRAVDHRRLRRRDQPRGHGAAVQGRPLRRRAARGDRAHHRPHRAGARRHARRRAGAAPRDARRAAARRSGSRRCSGIFIAILIISRIGGGGGGRAGGSGAAAAAGRAASDRSAAASAAVRRFGGGGGGFGGGFGGFGGGRSGGGGGGASW